MRQLMFFVLFLASCPQDFSQSLGPRLLGAAGAKVETQGISLSWSMGETMIGSLVYSSNALTQGFQQPELMESQVIALPQHWCFFSSYIDQDGKNIAAVTEDILPHFRLVKNSQGEVYIPAFGVNQIKPFRITEAYQSNLIQADTLVLRSFAVLPEQTAISLNAGWNLMTYLRREAAPMSDLMQSISNQLFLLKTYTGNIYWPAFSFNNVHNLRPGRGYSVRMNTSAIYYYRSNQEVLSKNLSLESTCRHFAKPMLGGENMTLAIPLNDLDEVPKKGDSVGAFSLDGAMTPHWKLFTQEINGIS